MKIILVSGVSGAGKSTALRILEDNNYYCVDNIPLIMLEQLILLYTEFNYNKIAIGIDTKTSPLLRHLPKVLKVLKNNGIELKLLYLDASDHCLVTRFSETRRRHPLTNENRTIEESIEFERNNLSEIAHLSHRIDTSDLSANALRRLVKDFVEADSKQMNIIVQSFGFKYGIPSDSDFVFDVRCLPNPHYSKEIKDFNGTQAPIIKFLEKEPQVIQMKNDIYNMVSRWFDNFSNDNRNYLTIGIGCTGGKHRSVYLAEAISKMILDNFPYTIITRHRQMIVNENKTN